MFDVFVLPCTARSPQWTVFIASEWSISSAAKTADHTLEMLKAVLGNDTRVAESAGQTDAGKKLLVHIKNTMSDRSIVEKNFNRLLEDYRKSILPEAWIGWNTLPEDERAAVSTVKNFYCGLHCIVGL